MQEGKNRFGSQGASHGEAYSVDILQEIYHSDPIRRCLAAMRGWGLDVLQNDEVWLVRHVVKKELRRQELKEAGVVLSPGDVEFTDAHIDDMVYELYKVDWLNKHTTPEMRMQSVRDWYCDVLRSREHESLPYAYAYWIEQDGYPIKDERGCHFYEGFYQFLGCSSPDWKGLYHNREYVAELLGHDEKLLALYDADINDDKELTCQAPSIGERLADATERSERTSCGSASKDEFALV